MEKEIDELGASVINIKLNKTKHHKKNNKEDNLNTPKKEEEKNINKDEGFNMDVLNNLLNQNVNIQIPSNNNNNEQLKSHIKPHLKKLNLGLNKKLTPIAINKEKNEDKENKENENINKSFKNIL